MGKLIVLEHRRKAMLDAMAALKQSSDAVAQATVSAPSTHAALVHRLSGAIITALDREVMAFQHDASFDMLDLIIAYPEANAMVLASMLQTMLPADRIETSALELASAHKFNLLRFATARFSTAPP
jgi:hypothetical protein